MLLTFFVDHLKYSPLGGLVALDQEIFLAPVRDVTLVERNFHFADSHHLSLLRLCHLRSVFLVSIAIKPYPDFVLILLPHLIWRSTNSSVVGVFV